MNIIEAENQGTIDSIPYEKKTLTFRLDGSIYLRRPELCAILNSWTIIKRRGKQVLIPWILRFFFSNFSSTNEQKVSSKKNFIVHRENKTIYLCQCAWLSCIWLLISCFCFNRLHTILFNSTFSPTELFPCIPHEQTTSHFPLDILCTYRYVAC